MKKEKGEISFRMIFYIELLSLLVFINSFSFYILEKAKEIDNPSKTSLSFTINGGVDQAFNEDKFFKIKTQIYKDLELITNKNAECRIPSSPQAEFGTTINVKCELDLLSSQNANNIKFIEFVINDNDLMINDLKKYVLESNLFFSKKIEMNADIEFTAENINLVKCSEDIFVFGIKGEFSSTFIRSFNFNITLNDNEQLKTKCESPDIYISKEETINCTLVNYKSLESLKNGIIIKESYYKAININNEEKILKIKIKDNNNKIELKEINCSPQKKDDNKSSGGLIDYFKNMFTSNKKTVEINKEEEEQKRWERQREEEKRKKKEQEEREREEEKRRRDQEDLAKYIIQRQKEKEDQERRSRKEIEDNSQNDNIRKKNYNDYNNDKYNSQRNEDNDDIDYNSNVKLLHNQVRYSYGFIYYMFYALTPVPLGHKIKVRFSITKYNYDNGYNEQENKYIILKTEEEITTNDRNIIIEYVARYDCQQCKKMIIDKNSIQGAKIYNIPEDQYSLDAIYTNQNNYLSRSKMENPPLYITDNIYTQNCLIYLNGNFFNKNKFFASKFALNLISNGYYNNKNVTVYCSLNERSIFSCPVTENLDNFEYKLQQFVIDQKENIIIDNSYVTREGMPNRVSCQIGNNMLQTNNDDKTNENIEEKKGWNWKRIIIIIIITIVLYYLISKYCCEKEEEYNDEYNSRWRVSSSNYGGGETYGLRSRGW